MRWETSIGKEKGQLRIWYGHDGVKAEAKPFPPHWGSVRMMFAQVLICVLRGGLEIIIHPWRARRGSWGLPSGRVPGPGPAPCLLTCAICVEDSWSPFEEFCCQPAKRETQRERQAAWQSSLECSFQSKLAPCRGHWGRCTGIWRGKGPVWKRCLFLCASSGPASFPYSSIPWKLRVWKNPLWTLHCGLFPSLFPPLPLSALRAGGETMIKSSWFYVKFKYTDKVSRAVFLFPRESCFSLRSLVDRSPSDSESKGAQECWIRMCFLRLQDSWGKPGL